MKNPLPIASLPPSDLAIPHSRAHGSHDSDAAEQLKSLLQAAGQYDLGGPGHESGAESGGAAAAESEVESAAKTVADPASRGWIRVSGSDRVRWLNGMVTNSMQQLQPGQGCYNFILSAQGRIQGDCYAFAQADSLLLETHREQVAPLLALLDRFIIMDDVELRDESAEWAGIRIAGPNAAELLSKLSMLGHASGIQLSDLQLNGFGHVRLVAAHHPGVPRFELWASPNAIQSLRNEVLGAGAALCGAEAVEWLRILEGIPLYGKDIRDKDLPQETAQAHALHFAKGCYIGQEIVERIRSRGAVHRTFSGFRLKGDLPAVDGTALEADGQKVGELTSSARIPLDGGEATLALGYVRREALERNTELRYPGGVAEAVGLPLRFS